MKRSARTLWRNADGAVAPTVALSLTALIAAGGIAFDYSRMASMDTELQSAADQAALAAAAQLDGGDGACERAVAAARNMLANQTKMSNDNGGLAVTIADPGVCNGDTTITFNANASIRFYQDVNKATPSDDDSNAKFVEVQVDDRVARYALTPIAAAFNSGQMHAIAFAGLDSAICKVPPLMLCNPNEESDPDFTITNYVGKGVRLVANDGGGIYGPGNFGFLAAGLGNGANVLRQILGRTALAADCVRGDGVTTEPGNMVAVRDALNTRFDIYDNGLNQACGNNAAQNGLLCPPSINTRKDVVQKGNGNNACGLVANGNANGWQMPANPYPGTLAAMPTTTTPRALTTAEAAALSPTGYPRDICHAFSIMGSCTPLVDGEPNRIGDGNWDRYAYFRSHPVDYPTITSVAAMNTFLMANFNTTTPTRYQVYTWEWQAANRAARLHTNVNLTGGLKASSQPVCVPASPGGTIPSETRVDRRVLTVAVVNCDAEGVRGRTPSVTVTKWIDVFLTEPALARDRTENSDVYVEVIGQTQNATDEGAVQLVKKSVPYLIE